MLTNILDRPVIKGLVSARASLEVFGMATDLYVA